MNTPITQWADAQIWEAFRQGNREVFGHLYETYADALYKFGCRVTPDTDLVEDCIQDLFIDLWRNRATLGPTEAIRFYLYKALRRKLVKALTRADRFLDESFLDEDAALEVVVSREVELVGEQLAEELRLKLQHHFEALSNRQREALLLRFYDNLSYQEIAEVMALSPQSVSNLLHRAMTALREGFLPTLLLLLLLNAAA